MDSVPPIEICRESALSLLEARAHTVSELRRKLLAKTIRRKDAKNPPKFTRSDVQIVIQDLIQAGLLDDVSFAKLYCESLQASSSPIGSRKAHEKLIRHGVSAELARKTLAEVWCADAEEELLRAQDAATRRLPLIIKATPEGIKRRQKLMRFLAGRGFSSFVISQVIRRMGV